MRMRRFTPAMLASAIGACLAPAVLADPTIDVQAPVLPTDVETVGLDSIVILDLAATASSALTDAQPVTFSVQVFTVDASDMVNTIGGATVVPSGAVDANNDGTFGDGVVYANAGVTGIAIDLGQVNIEILLNTALAEVMAGNAVSAGIQIIATDASMNMDTTLIDTASGVPQEATDESLDFDLDELGFEGAFLNDMGDTLTIVFNRSTSLTAAGTGVNSVNQTIEADVDGNDFQLDADNDFSMGAIVPTNVTGTVDLIGANFNAYQFTLGMGTNVAIGQFLRFTGMDASDVLGNLAADIDPDGDSMTQDGVMIQATTALAVDSAAAILEVPADPGDANGATTFDAIRVTFNNPLANAGDTTYWNAMVLERAGMDSNINITAAAIDPMNASAVILTVDPTDTDAIGPDGMDLDGMGNLIGYTLAVPGPMTGTPPQDIFGQDFGGTSAIAVGDGIAPARPAGTFQNAAFQDRDGDGTQEAVVIVFNEPLASGSANNDDGVTLTANDGVTVHPTFATNLATGARAGDPNHPDMDLQTAITTDIDPMANELDIDSQELISVDVNGNGMIDPREMNNAVAYTYDLDSVDWDGDGNAGMDDTDGEATGTTDDGGLVQIALVAMDSSIVDPAGNSAATDITVSTAVDLASPVALAVNFLTGDNIAAGMQKPSEQDGVVGDGDDNIAQLIMSEGVDASGIDLAEFRFGTGPSENFGGGSSFVGGTDNNLLQLQDDAENGWSADSSLTVRAGNGVEDLSAQNNPVEPITTGVPATNRTAPYIALQSDVNGFTIISAFLVDENGNGFAERIDLFFTQAIDNNVEDDNFSVQGVDDSEITGITVDGSVVSIPLPTDTVPISSTVDVTYNGATDDTLIGADGNFVAMMDDTFTARQVPTPTVDSEFPAVQLISGAITLDGTVGVPAGTKVFGMIAYPRAKVIRGTVNNVSFAITDETSLEAVTNVVIGAEEFAYLYNDGGDMFVRNEKSESFFDNNEQRSISQLVIQAANLTNVTFTARGSTQGGGFAPSVVTITGGRITFSWDVLRSSDGTAKSLFVNGVGDAPIVSATVLEDDTGEYTLAMGAPINAFNGRFDTRGFPVIVVVELPTGERFAASGLANSVDGNGPLTFDPNNRKQETNFSASGATEFDINLTNIGAECLWNGWNLLKFARQSGFATNANGVPVLPRDVSMDEVVVGVSASTPLIFPLSQFVYFVDDDGDGEWTAADDDSNTLDGIIVDVNCIEHFAFIMTSRGVFTSSAFKGRFTNNILGLVGGYAVGFFNGEMDGSNNVKLGVFQFGAPITSGPIFTTATPFPNNNITLGWGLVSNTFEGAPGDFFTNNPNSDFFIEFDRTSHTDVEITVGSMVSGADTSNDEVECQALFVHFEN